MRWGWICSGGERRHVVVKVVERCGDQEVLGCIGGELGYVEVVLGEYMLC